MKQNRRQQDYEGNLDGLSQLDDELEKKETRMEVILVLASMIILVAVLCILGFMASLGW